MLNRTLQIKIYGGQKMGLRDYLVSEENLYLAIYAVKSYVFDPQLLDKGDKEMLNKLMDPFNEKYIRNVIEDVRVIVEKILNDDNFLFETQVYFKPKEYEKKPIYRPIHTAKLKQLIAMVAIMHPLVYEIPKQTDNWKLNLSNYSRLIPNNFYGNRISKRPEELFKKWNEQYKLYTQKANEYFKTYHESKEYKFELKLDLKNFFPSVNPLIVYGILIEKMPVTICDQDDIWVLKTIISKLLVCKVTNLNSEYAREIYYECSDVYGDYTKGIPQGLPQSYFFGNICMTEISNIFDKKYKGKSVYYVDDSYIYTSEPIISKTDFEIQLCKINDDINSMELSYIKIAQNDIIDNQHIGMKRRVPCLDRCKDKGYGIEVHVGRKSYYTDIQNSREGEIYLRTLSREASQIGTDITSTYSDEEDAAIMSRTEALLESIELEREKNIEEIYKEKLERYYKFFKYRQIKLKLKTQKSISPDLFDALFDDSENLNEENIYDVIAKREISTKKFFDNYKHDIWQVGMSLLIMHTVYEHKSIRRYIGKVIKKAYPPELIESSYIYRIYEDYLKDNQEINITNRYETLEKKVNQQMVKYANLNTDILNKMFKGVVLDGLKEDILSSFEICTQPFVNMCKIVNMNSNRLKRMFLNAVYSKIFKVTLSDDIVLNSYDKKGITYGELRALVYLRNSGFDAKKFLNWKMELKSAENQQNVDYTVFEVLGAYKRYVVKPENIDNLIVIHKYTCDVWKNGAKHLYFYTLHNQEHAVDLIKNIIKIVKVFSYFRISNYDYYILFIACYLHDISMVRIASDNDFLLDTQDSEIITSDLDVKWNAVNNTSEIKKAIVDTYKAVDNFYEKKIRSMHAKDSADEIRKRGELDFLDASIRECVAEIAESHMLDTKDIYFVKGDAKSRLISYKFDKILLRFADLLDMSEHRVSQPILNHNIENMSIVSAFHWVSHLITNGYELISKYEIEPNSNSVSSLKPGSITETVTLSIFINLSQFSKIEASKCTYGKINEETLSDEGFTIELLRDNQFCNSDKCNFLCKWFNDKNNYLVKEMQALELYLSRVPLKDRFYNTKILIKVVVKNPTHISDEQFGVLMKKVCSND